MMEMIKKCGHCDTALTAEEIEYYENSCEKCEAKFSDDMAKERPEQCDFLERKLKLKEPEVKKLEYETTQKPISHKHIGLTTNICPSCVNKNLIDAEELMDSLRNHFESVPEDSEQGENAYEFNEGLKCAIDIIKSKLSQKQEELKPCVCGKIPNKYIIDDLGDRKVSIGCGVGDCKLEISTKWFKSEVEAVAAWNKLIANRG